MSLDDSFQELNKSNKTQSGQALNIQAYCSSILKQKKVDFSYDNTLVRYQNQINDYLTSAQGNASYYINTLLPKILGNLSNINNYCNLHAAVPVSMPQNETVQDWEKAIAALIEISQQYSTEALDLSNAIKDFATTIDQDYGDFTAVVSDLNSAVGGDNGALSSIKTQLEGLQTKIIAEEAGVAASFIGILGGIVQIFIGAFSELFTGGASTALVISGSITLATGVAGETTAAVELVADTNLKANLIAEETQLSTEVKVAQAIADGYKGLATRNSAASSAAEGMANAWTILNQSLTTLSQDLTSGLSSTGYLQTLFLTTSNGELKTVQTDTATIVTQMTGVNIVTASAGQTLFDILPSTSKIGL